MSEKCRGTNFIQSSKVICLSNNSQQSQLIYKEQIAENIIEKSYNNGNSKEFSFTTGDMLKLKGISGDYDYATVIVFEPTVSTTYTFSFVECTDGDGNNYAVVTIGQQTWFAENLNYQTADSWWYDNSSTNGDIYGRLYTWSAALNSCPAGWHLPSDAE